MKKLIKFIGAHKVIAVILLLIIVYGGYRLYASLTSTAGVTSYVLASATKGTIVSTVSGSGQVATTQQVNVTPQVSAQVTAILVQNGQTVKAGQVIARLDATNQIKAVDSAQASLQNAQISLEKLQAPPTTSTIAQAQYSLLQAQQSIQNSSTTLSKDYLNAGNSIASAYNDFPGVISGLGDVLYGNEASSKQQNVYAYHDLALPYSESVDQFSQSAVTSYVSALASYNQSFLDYKNQLDPSATSSIESMLTETYGAAQAIKQAVVNVKNFMDFVNSTLQSQGNGGGSTSGYAKQLPAVFATQETNLAAYLTTVSGDVSGILTYENTLASDKSSILAAQQNLVTQQASYAEMEAGPNPLDVQSGQLAIEQAQNNLTDAQNTLADYTIRAPFDGIVASVGVSVGDNASGGTTIATLITQQQYAEIPLNEVDAAKVAVGQKATLTFDALPNLTIAGHVTEIDTIGTVSQGVVTYNAQVALDTQNSGIKPGMSVSADIATNVATDALDVPNAAVKSQNQTYYVQYVASSSIAQTLPDGSVVLNAAPETRTVTVGIADDTNTQILSGLNEGDQVVLRTVAPSVGTTQAAAPSGGGLGGLGGGASRVFRIGG